MKWVRAICFFTLVCAVSFLTLPNVVAKKTKDRSAPMDDGRLDPKWFGNDLIFREADEIDYLWVKDGLDLSGKTLHFEAWPAPEFLGEDAEDRDENDRRLARLMNDDMNTLFADVFGRRLSKTLKASTAEGDILVSGRIVDCSTGSGAAKAIVGFGAGSGSTTIDVKFVEKATGALLVGFHHRVVSGTEWSTTDSKFVGWVDDMAEEVADKGFVKLYQKGDEKDD